MEGSVRHGCEQGVVFLVHYTRQLENEYEQMRPFVYVLLALPSQCGKR